MKPFLFVILILLGLPMGLGGCAGMETPTPPTLHGVYELGDFTYAAYETGEVKRPNDVLHQVGGDAYLNYDIAPYVKEIHHTVFQKSGLQKKISPYVIYASVDRLFINDSGFTYGFTYTVTYRIIEKASGAEKLHRTYTQHVDVGVYFNVNFGVSLDRLYTLCATEFMNDAEVQKIVGWTPA